MGATRPQLRIEQSELVYHGHLEAPLLRLLTIESGAHDRLLAALEPFGARLENLTINHGQDLSQSNFTITFLGGFATLRLWAQWLELRFSFGGDSLRGLPPLTAERLSDLLVHSTAALQVADDRARIMDHTLTMSFHGRLVGTTVAELMARYVNPPPDTLGSPVSSGVRYLFPGAEEVKSTWIYFEPSTAITPDGLYVTCAIILEGALVSTVDVCPLAKARLDQVLGSAGLPVEVFHA